MYDKMPKPDLIITSIAKQHVLVEDVENFSFRYNGATSVLIMPLKNPSKVVLN